MLLMILNFALLYTCTFASLMQVSLAEPENDSVIVRLAVHVLDIDQSRKLAEIKAYVYIDNFPYNLTSLWTRLIGGGSLYIYCENKGPMRVDTWFYQGESNQTA